jgi:uncharacterized lipoprotein
MHLRLFLTLFLLTGLVGCSHIYGDRGVIKNHDTDYLKAHDIAPLKLPPGISNTNIEPRYPVAQKEYAPTDKRVVLTPPELNPKNTPSQ